MATFSCMASSVSRNCTAARDAEIRLVALSPCLAQLRPASAYGMLNSRSRVHNRHLTRDTAMLQQGFARVIWNQSQHLVLFGVAKYGTNWRSIHFDLFALGFWA